MPHGYDAPVITLDDIDPYSGIVDVSGATCCKLSRQPRGSQYELRPGDIVMGYNGAISTIGKCGFMLEEDTGAVSASNIFLIRPDGIDPKWLFYRLRQMEDRLKKMACLGKNRASWFLPIEKLGEIRLPEPSASIVKEVNDLFGEIRKKSVQREETAREMIAVAQEIDRIIMEGDPKI